MKASQLIALLAPYVESMGDFELKCNGEKLNLIVPHDINKEPYFTIPRPRNSRVYVVHCIKCAGEEHYEDISAIFYDENDANDYSHKMNSELDADRVSWWDRYEYVYTEEFIS